MVGAAAPRRRHAVRIRTANSPCEFAVRIMANSVHLPAADARSVPKTLAVGGAVRICTACRRTPCEFAEFTVRIMARRANLHCGTVNGLDGYGVGIWRP